MYKLSNTRLKEDLAALEGVKDKVAYDVNLKYAICRNGNQYIGCDISSVIGRWRTTLKYGNLAHIW